MPVKQKSKSFAQGTADMKVLLSAYRKTLAMPVASLVSASEELSAIARKHGSDEWLEGFAAACDIAVKSFRSSVFDCLVNALYRAATERSDE